MDRGGELVGLNPMIRVYRYTKGQFFDCHCKLTGSSTLRGKYQVGSRGSFPAYKVPELQFLDCLCTLQYQKCLRSPAADDETNVLTLPTSPKPTPARTTWTLLLYLTSSATGCQGGQTVFYPDELPHKTSPIDNEVVVELETGMLVLHKHGNDCMLVSFPRLNEPAEESMDCALMIS
jgi:hypothetical protein